MEEKKSKSTILIVLLVIAIVAIVAMGVYICKLTTDKKDALKKVDELQAQVTNLNADLDEMQEKINTISETINGNTSNSDSDSEDFETIVLDGNYSVPSSDGGWDFTKDGKAASSGNVSVMQGTYKTTGKNSIEVHYTKSKVWDENTSEVTITDIDKYEKFTIDDDNNLYFMDSNGEKVKLQRFGEASKENFE